jgi:hypothetical protein
MVATLAPIKGLSAISMEQAVDRVAAEVTGVSPQARVDRALALVRDLIDRYADPRQVISHDEAAYLLLVCHDWRVRDPIIGFGVNDDDLEPLSRVLLDVARRAVPTLGAPAWAMYAWVAYSTGDAAVAMEAVDRALGHDPTYSLATLLQEVAARQVHPEQVRSTWGIGVTDGAGVRQSGSEQ